jgi:hypothetical protein
MKRCIATVCCPLCRCITTHDVHAIRTFDQNSARPSATASPEDRDQSRSRSRLPCAPPDKMGKAVPSIIFHTRAPLATWPPWTSISSACAAHAACDQCLGYSNALRGQVMIRNAKHWLAQMKRKNNSFQMESFRLDLVKDVLILK